MRVESREPRGGRTVGLIREVKGERKVANGLDKPRVPPLYCEHSPQVVRRLAFAARRGLAP